MSTEPVQQPEAQTLQLPVVELSGVHMEVQDHPSGGKVLVVGPVALALPMTEQAASIVAQGLTASSLLVVPAHAIPNGAAPLH